MSCGSEGRLIGNDRASQKGPAARDVWASWEERGGGGLSEGCSLFDDGDVELLREMMAESVLSVPNRAHALASGWSGRSTRRI